MNTSVTAGPPKRALVTAADWFASGHRIPYEHRQIAATRERVPEARILTFPGGHLTTSEHPDLLAAAIHDIAARHGVGTAATTAQLAP